MTGLVSKALFVAGGFGKNHEQSLMARFLSFWKYSKAWVGERETDLQISKTRLCRTKMAWGALSLRFV